MNLRVFAEGMPEWKKNKGLIVAEPDSLKVRIRDDDPYVLIDLRDPKAAKAGHIKGAVNIPMASLAKSRDLLPSDMSAPVYLYDEAEASRAAFDTVRGWGYKNAAILGGGARAWVASGGRLLDSELLARAEYVKKPKAGEIAPDEFRKIADGRAGDAVVLDVREGSVPGRLPGAIAIPGGELQARLGELPKGKEFVVHCNTGILAGMAYKTLADAGMKARFLNAVIQVAPDGSFEITEK